MISTETITIDGKELTHTYSDTYKIRKIGTDEIYTDAMDVLDYQYEETDMPLEIPEATEDDMREALSINNNIIKDNVIYNAETDIITIGLNTVKTNNATFSV